MPATAWLGCGDGATIEGCWRPRWAVAVQLSVFCVHWHCTAAAGLGPLQQPTSEHKTAVLIKQSVFKEHKLEHAKEKEGGSGPGKTGEDKAKPLNTTVQISSSSTADRPALSIAAPLYLKPSVKHLVLKLICVS